MRQLARFIANHPKKIFFGYMVAAIWPFFVIRTEFNAPFPIAFRYLALPIVAGSGWLGVRYRDEFIRVYPRKRTYWLVLVCITLLVTLWSAGFVVQANALLPPQRRVWLDGIVTAKTITGGRSKSWIVDVRTEQGVKRVEVSHAEYAALAVGMPFQQLRRIGPLGFTYLWIDENAPISVRRDRQPILRAD